ncbi:MAG: mechanosensitive ion channel [Nanoarchaeota archaeon]|nr:mechanosensitive ion channel [Nanoarchaeota archaeon]
MTFLSSTINYVKNNITIFLKNLIVAIIIILIGIIIAKTINKFIYRILNEIEINQVIKKFGWKFNLEKFISKLVYYVIVLITIAIALSQLKLATTVLNIIITATIILIGFLTVIWLKDFFPNLFTGFLIKKTKRLREGNTITIKHMKIQGKIKKIGLTEIIIITKNKDNIYMPYSSFYRYDIMLKK